MNAIKVNGQVIDLQEVEIPTANGTETQLEAQFFSKILSVSDNILENSNGTEYRIATIQFADANGELVRHSAIMWEKSVQQYFSLRAEKAVGPDSDHLTTIRVAANRELPSLNVSHLTTTGQAQMSTFGLDSISVGKTESVEEVANTVETVEEDF